MTIVNLSSKVKSPNYINLNDHLTMDEELLEYKSRNTHDNEENKMTNIYIKIYNKVHDTTYYKLYCINLNKCGIISKEDYVNIEKLQKSWSINNGGYIYNNNTNDDLYLHQIILKNLESNPFPNIYSVDHINRDKLDNRRENLRWASQATQNQNRDKKKRSKSAKPLPDGITQDMMKIYVNYNSEGKVDTPAYRNFFRVEKHPLLDKFHKDKDNKAKVWSTTKSCEFTIQEKLEMANKFVKDLDKIKTQNEFSKLLEKFKLDNSKLLKEKRQLVKQMKKEKEELEQIEKEKPQKLVISDSESE
jgi:hypothetical protein